MHIGLHSSSVSQVQIYEPQAEPNAGPWAVIADVQADVPALSLLRGAALPRALTLREVAVTLRFDPKGQLLTRLPSAAAEAPTLPVLHLERGQLTLRQEGRPDMVLHGIDAEVHDYGDHYVMEGTVTDPYWGQWNLQGTFARTHAGTFTLKTPHVHITQAMLDQLPFV